MPESVRDRLNCRYELIFLLVRSRRYWFDLDPIRVPHATRAGRHAPATRPARVPGGRPGRQHGSRPARRPATRPPKYGPHTRQVIGARRYGIEPHRRPSQRPQPRRRLVDPHPPLPRPALRRLPARTADSLHPGRLQARRHGARPVLRHRHDRHGRPRTRPPVHRHRPQPGIRRACRRTAAASRRPSRRHTAAARRHARRLTGMPPAATGTAHGKKPLTPRHKSPAQPPPKRARERTLAGPEQGRAAHPGAPSRRQPKTRPGDAAGRAASAHPGSGPGPAPGPAQGPRRPGRRAGRPRSGPRREG